VSLNAFLGERDLPFGRIGGECDLGIRKRAFLGAYGSLRGRLRTFRGSLREWGHRHGLRGGNRRLREIFGLLRGAIQDN